MIIAGLQKLTLLDYPGKISCIIFTQGCNFACGYCHNAEMIPILQEQKPGLEETRVINFLKSRRSLLDGVVITGGEPTLQKDLVQFMEKIKELGFLIKLDSNGSNPEMLLEVLEKKLVDYIAIDVKTTLSKYKDLVKNDVSEKIEKSIRILMNSEIDYEFRSTILPSIHSLEDIHEIGTLIQGAKNWYLQSFRPIKTLQRSFQLQKSFTSEELQHLESIAKNYAQNVGIRS